jgi:hypothetical protein
VPYSVKGGGSLKNTEQSTKAPRKKKIEKKELENTAVKKIA